MQKDIKKFNPFAEAKKACLSRHKVEEKSAETQKDPDLGKTGSIGKKS